MSRPQEFAPEAPLEDLGVPQGGRTVELVQLLGLQGLWQDQVLRGAGGLDRRKYGALRVFVASGCSVLVGVEHGSGTGAWIMGTLATPDT